MRYFGPKWTAPFCFCLALSVFSPDTGFAETSPQAASSSAFASIRIGGDEVKQGELDNGMQVVVIPDYRAPVATHMVWYKVGSADEPLGKSGIAHFLEHLMFKGTKNTPEGVFSQKVAEVGGEENAFTSRDFTAYYQRIAREHLKMVMGYEADRMANLILTDEQILPERSVVLQERALRVDNNPSAMLAESYDQMLYANSTYGIPVIGWRNEIEQLNKEDAINFYNTFYTPNNAILIVAGDVTFDEVMAAAKDTYGKLKRRAEPPTRTRTRVEQLPGSRLATFSSDQVAQPALQRGWVVPSANTAEPGVTEALDVLSDIVGGGSNSRLYEELVVKQKIATSVALWYRSTALGDTELAVFGIPSEGNDIEGLTKAIEAVLADVIKNGVSEEELERSKRSMLASAIYAQDKQTALARIFGSELTTGQELETIQEWPARIAKVSAEDVHNAAKKFLTENYVTSHLLPTKTPSATTE